MYDIGIHEYEYDDLNGNIQWISFKNVSFNITSLWQESVFSDFTSSWPWPGWWLFLVIFCGNDLY